MNNIKGIPNLNLGFLVLCLKICIPVNIPILPPIKLRDTNVFSEILYLCFIALFLSINIIIKDKKFIIIRYDSKIFINPPLFINITISQNLNPHCFKIKFIDIIDSSINKKGV